jgi:PGF-CTERM protein
MTKASEQDVKVKAPGFTVLLVLIGLMAAIGFVRRR